ncbi:hypothetical protein [Acinetobacter towneri]|uniref:hypothetical protein n=1 Tax=Acinetobacter towneri TaxID=202956 RepID=UPI002577AF76|nr:hypothetical protein [Acinetobacter towneri]MDM1720526.1 hypothetical protein [Acinetobacter towneri]
MASKIEQQIASAKQAGYKDHEIWNELRKTPEFSNSVKQARAAGYGQNEIAQQLGLNVRFVDSKPKQQPAPKPEKPSFLADVGAGMDDVTSRVKQGVLWYGDKAAERSNALLGTNFETNDYEKFSREKAAEKKLYEKARKESGAGMNVGRFVGQAAATAPLAGLSKGYGAAKVLSGAGAKITAQNAAVGGLIGGLNFAENAEESKKNIIGGAVGGALGGIAGRGIEKVSQKASQKIAQKATQKALDAPKNALITDARNAGYSVPPSYSNPNFINKSLAKVAGEADLARIASAKNQQVTNNLARKSVGLADDQPITVEALAEVRKQAGQAYKVLNGFGEIQTDRKFAKDLIDITKNYTSAGRDFNVAGGDRIQNIVNQVRSDRFGSDAALNMIKIARNDASAAFRAGDTDLGLANQKLANAIEGQLERAVAQNTKVPRAAVENFINARKVIAKTYSIENALDATGNVSARKLASTLGKKPLTSELKQAAQFSQAYPQLNNIGVHGGNGITLFDSLVGIGGGVATGNPAVAALTLGRPALKAGLNSNAAGKFFGTPSYNSALLRIIEESGKVAPALPVVGANAAKD